MGFNDDLLDDSEAVALEIGDVRAIMVEALMGAFRNTDAGLIAVLDPSPAFQPN